MNSQSREILRSLAEVAWADGEVTEEERALLFTTCFQLGASEEEVEELHEILGEPDSNPPSQDELKAVLPDKASRLNVMRALLTMSFVDGALAFAEYDVIEKKCAELEISAEELETLRQEALEAAKSFNKI